MVLEDNAIINVAYRNVIARKVKKRLRMHARAAWIGPKKYEQKPSTTMKMHCACFSPHFSFITNRPRPLNHPITVPFTESRAPINSQHFNWSLPSIKFCATINDKTSYQRVTSTQNRGGRMDSTERFTIIRKYEQKSAIVEKAFQWTSHTNSSTK